MDEKTANEQADAMAEAAFSEVLRAIELARPRTEAQTAPADSTRFFLAGALVAWFFGKQQAKTLLATLMSGSVAYMEAPILDQILNPKTLDHLLAQIKRRKSEPDTRRR